MRGVLRNLLQIDVRGRAALIFAFGMIVGSAWYFSIWHEPSLTWILAAWFITIACFLVVSRWNAPLILSLSVAATGTSTGALSGKLATLRIQHTTISEPIGPVMVEGWVKLVEPSRTGVRLVIKLHAVAGLDTETLPATIRLTHRASLEVEPGRFVRCWAVLRPPPAPVIEGDYAFDRQAWYGGLGAVGYVQGRCRGGSLGVPPDPLSQIDLRISQSRRQLARYVNEAAGERAGGFAAALASGDRSYMSEADKSALRDSGLAHLLAISGLHMGIVGGLVYLIIWRGLALIEPLALRVPIRKPAAIAALAIAFTYLVLSGASVSTQRAFIMLAVFFGAVLVDRTALSLRSLAIAMILIILIAPWSVLTPGFQMSFAATGALIATYEAWQRRRREENYAKRSQTLFWLQSLFVTSAVSGLATMPFALYHFNRVASLGLAANLAAMPIVSLVSAPLAGVALVLAPFGLSDLALRGFGLSLEAILGVASYFDRLGDRIPVALPELSEAAFMFMVLTLIFGCLLSGYVKRYGAMVVGSCASLILWFGGSQPEIHIAPSADVYVVSEQGSAIRIKFAEGDGLAPLRYADIDISVDCRSRSICEADVNGVRLAILDAPNVDPCEKAAQYDAVISLRGYRPCGIASGRPVVSWGDVQAYNGVTLQKHGDEYRVKPKPPCGARPWRTCPTELSSRSAD